LNRTDCRGGTNDIDMEFWTLIVRGIILGFTTQNYEIWINVCKLLFAVLEDIDVGKSPPLIFLIFYLFHCYHFSSCRIGFEKILIYCFSAEIITQKTHRNRWNGSMIFGPKIEFSLRDSLPSNDDPPIWSFCVVYAARGSSGSIVQNA
jgi:hypothetical protein